MADNTKDLTENAAASAEAAVQTAEKEEYETPAALKMPPKRNYMADVSDNTSKPAEPKTEPKKERFAALKKFNALRKSNTTKFSKLNLFLLIFFPVFITLLCEIIQAKKPSVTLSFFTDHPTVFIFDLIITSIIYIFLLALSKSGWISALIEGVAYVTLATVELFKYNTNGNHLLLSDMRLAKNAKSLSSFAYVKITWGLILCYVIGVLVLAAIFYFNPKVKFKAPHRVAASLASVIIIFAMIIYPKFYKPVYKVFKIDTTNATNAFLLNEKFDNNSFIAFLVQTASESYANRLTKPDDYNKAHVNSILNIKPDTSGDFNGGKKPNVIYIMSESYADFRVFDELNVDDSYYELFDKARAEGKSGTLITPTYASWTVRAEFELMFGLPVKGLNDANMPQRLLAKHSLPAIARYYNSWGYNTAYVHPFQSGFYDRDKIYSRFGFKDMIYHDDQDNVTDFTVDVNHYGTYVDDSSVFNQILALIKGSDEPMYIHTTTMQNHQPYDQGEDPNNEFGNYLQWIQHTNEGLDAFLSELKKLDEPTLVFFVGDHFPSLKSDTSVYNQLGFNGENCDILYEQKYFFWSNYDADFSKVPDEKYSFFYVPYVIFNIIDAPHDAFIEKMMKYLKDMPVYSTSYNAELPDNEDLDMLTYDRAVGKIYSTSPLDD